MKKITNCKEMEVTKIPVSDYHDYYSPELNERLTRIEAAALSQKNVFTFDEACRFTGLSRSHLYKLTSSQRIPHYKPFNKLIYFERSQLEKWLLQNKVTTIAEIDQEAANYFKEKEAAK
jgi:excisionase family DNA binding protein